MLEALDRGNLFLVPLDDRRRWYRYHHLFADVLQARLLDEQHGQVPDLHRRASAWYQQNGELMAALLRALAKQGTAGNYVRRLLAACGPAENHSPVKQALIEPLSERELDVLRLLGTDLAPHP
jgi:ATP/maltotriose-dependent transcriptional regulator MalT